MTKQLSKFATLFVFFAGTAFADSSEHAMNIHEGNWIGEGSMSFNSYSEDWSGSGKAFSIGGSGSYFLVDHFSLGGLLTFSDGRSSDASSFLGILADYYLPTGQTHTARLGGEITLGLAEDSADRIFRLNAGWLYFFRPEFAWGPTFQWNLFKNGSFSGSRIDLNFSFAYAFY